MEVKLLTFRVLRLVLKRYVKIYEILKFRKSIAPLSIFRILRQTNNQFTDNSFLKIITEFFSEQGHSVHVLTKGDT